MNIEAAQKEFLNYTEQFDTTNIKISNKVSHSIRVMELSKNIAENLNLSKEEIEIATLIGLLHDIGRFEQQTKYQTYNDLKSVDHGDLGVKILEENNYIRKYNDKPEYDKIIY